MTELGTSARAACTTSQCAPCSSGLADVFGESISRSTCSTSLSSRAGGVGAFCAGKRALLVIEEGHRLHRGRAAPTLRRRDLQTGVHRERLLPLAGEYTGEVVLPAREVDRDGAAPRPASRRPVARSISRSSEKRPPNCWARPCPRGPLDLQ